jgi:hypothetical protein
MKRNINPRSFPISEKFRIVSIVIFYVSVALVALSLVSFPVFCLIGILAANGRIVLIGFLSIVFSLLGIVIGQLLVLLVDTLSIITHKFEKDLTPEETVHFNNSFSLPEGLAKKYAEAKQKNAAKKAADAERTATSKTVTPPPPAPSVTVTPLSPVVPEVPLTPVQPEAPKEPSPSNTSWTCTCGQVNAEDAKFCTNCGSPKPASLF